MRALVLLTLMGFTLGNPAPDRIVGGSVTTIETYPFMANMQYGLFGIIWFHSCGGVLITDRTVLSAAHCFEEDPPSLWRAVLGSTWRTTGGNIHTIARITQHPSFDELTMDADVAVLQLTSRAEISASVATVTIASAMSALSPGLPVTVVGWGDTEFQGSPSEQLQHVEIFIIDQATCARQYAELRAQPGMSNTPLVTPGMACAGIPGVGGRDGCHGDAGGPVLFRGMPHIVVGIASWGHECAHANYPGVMARVPQYTDWIVANAT